MIGRAGSRRAAIEKYGIAAVIESIDKMPPCRIGHNHDHATLHLSSGVYYVDHRLRLIWVSPSRERLQIFAANGG